MEEETYDLILDTKDTGSSSDECSVLGYYAGPNCTFVLKTNYSLFEELFDEDYMENNYLNMKFIGNDNTPFDINCRFWKPETINLALICNMDDDASNYSRKIKLDKYVLNYNEKN